MKKISVAHLVIFGIVIIIILSAPYLIRIFGFASSNVGTSVKICFNGPYYIEPKPSTTQSATAGNPFSVDLYFKDTDTIPPLTVTADPNWFVITTQASGSNKTIATLTMTPNINQAGTNAVIVTASDGVCDAEANFNLVVSSGTATPTPSGGGGLRRSCIVQTQCGGCIDGQKRCVRDDSCGTATIYYESCFSRGRCSADDDCPRDSTCEEGTCAPITAELEEIPVIKEEPAIIYPPIWQYFFNNKIIDYPSPGIVLAIRQGLFTPKGKIDLSFYNLYHDSQETNLGKWMKEHQLIRNFFLILVALAVIISMFKAVKTAKTHKKSAVEFGMLYQPPELN